MGKDLKIDVRAPSLGPGSALVGLFQPVSPQSHGDAHSGKVAGNQRTLKEGVRDTSILREEGHQLAT